MKKLFSLLKATMSYDMELFKINSKSEIKKIILIFLLSMTLMFSMGSLAYGAMNMMIVNDRYIVICMFILAISMLTIMESIYKSQGILFNAKDTELLFSLPINKNNIFLVRIIKLLIFQFLFDSIFIFPSMIAYMLIANITISFCISSIVMLILIPIIPTTIGCILGYLIKKVSTKSRFKKLIELTLTIISICLSFIISFNFNDIINYLQTNAGYVENIIEKIYYPIKLYSRLISKLNILDILKLLFVNITPIILFVYIASKSYLKLTSNDSVVIKNKYNKNLKFNKHNKIKSLIVKDLKRFLSSTIYIINSGFSAVLIIVVTILLCINFNSSIDKIYSSGLLIDLDKMMYYLPLFYICLIILMSFITNITASMISMEGHSINITKSLPVKIENILFSKVLTSNIIIIPAIIISDIIFITYFKVKFINIIFILIVSIIFPTISAIINLLINLKFPNMNANNDTEIVKQSTSSIISIFLGIFVGIIISSVTIYFCSKYNMYLILVIESFIFIVILILLIITLKKYGVRKFKEIVV